MDDAAIPPPVEPELAELRRRAYGPQADIATDPAAQARLLELETRRRQQAAEAAASASVQASRAPVSASAVPAIAAAVTPAVAASVSTTPAAAADPYASARTPAAARWSAATVPAWTTASPPPLVTAEPDAAGRAASSPGRRFPRPRWHTAMVVSVAVVAALLGAVSSEVQLAEEAARAAAEAADVPAVFSENPTVRVLMYVPVDRALAGGESEPENPPEFPVPEDLRWSEQLGEFYGWDLWRARSRSGLPCVLVADRDETRARCVPAFRFDASELGVTVPYLRIEADERPEGMKATESIGFWWLPDGRLCIVMGRLPNAGTTRAADAASPSG